MHIEPLESRRLMADVTGFMLVNSDTDLDIGPITDGQQVNVEGLRLDRLNIRADATGSGRVILNLSGAKAVRRVEDNAPYALFGNNGSDYLNGSLPLGNYTLFADGAVDKTISFSLVEDDVPPPPPPPPPSGRPGPDNTGPRFSTLTTRGGLTVTTNGTTFERVRFTGQVTVRADDVSFRDCIFTTGRYNIESNSDSVDRLLIEYCEFTGSSSAAIYGESLTVQFSEIHHSDSDGVKPSGSDFVMRSNWVHHLGMSESSHADGVQARVSSGTWTGLAFIGNYFDMPIGLSGFNSNATIFLQAVDSGRIENAQVIGNWLNGGNYNCHITTGASSVDFIGNQFGRNHRYGIFKGPVDQWSENRWMDTGALIPRP